MVDQNVLNDYLIFASKVGRTEDVKLLLNKGANVHAIDYCSLRVACYNGHTEVVKLLLQCDIDIHVEEIYVTKCITSKKYRKLVQLLEKYIYEKKSSNI